METIRSEGETSKTYINKLAAAERQLAAAIEMYYLEMDALAIHTVSSAAHNLFADMMRNRGKEPTIHGIDYGLYRLARDVNDGVIGQSEIDCWGKEVASLVDERVAILKANPSFNIEEMSTSAPSHFQKTFWNKKRKAYNFLKHADSDAQSLLDFGSINNEDIIFEAISWSMHLNATYSPAKHFFFCTMLALGRIDRDTKKAWDLELIFLELTPEQIMAFARGNLCRATFADDDSLRKVVMPDISKILERANGREILFFPL